MASRLLLTLPLLAALGCGSDVPDFPDVAPVTGTVKHAGKPVEGATITFNPATPGEGKFAATATSAADGTYTLTTFFSPAAVEEGAVPGDYKVTVMKSPPFDPSKVPAHGDDVVVRDVPETAPTYLLPKQYAAVETTPLTASIKEGQDNVVPLELK
jgi:hypothetical protein